MILMEALLFFMICTILISVLFNCIWLRHELDVRDQKGYQDEDIREIYAQ